MVSKHGNSALTNIVSLLSCAVFGLAPCPAMAKKPDHPSGTDSSGD